MPKFNHENLGDVLRYAYLPGVILKTYIESPKTDSSTWDTADVSLSYDGSVHYSCPVFYHCTNNEKRRANGSLTNGARGFAAGDLVVCRCQIPKGGFGSSGSSFSSVSVVGHVTGPQKCSFRYVLIRISDSDLKELEQPFGHWETGEDGVPSYVANHPNSLAGESAIIFDTLSLAPAKIVNPTSAFGSYYDFPCCLEDLKPALDTFALDIDTDLYRYVYQGTKLKNIEFASGSPNYENDPCGDLLGVNPKTDPFSSYYKPNVVIGFFNAINDKILISKNIRSGDFSDIKTFFEANEGVVNNWKSRSPAFIYDSRTFLCDGPNNESNQSIPDSVKEEVAKLQSKISTYTDMITTNLVTISSKQDLLNALNDSYDASISEINALIAQIKEIAENASLSDPAIDSLVSLNKRVLELQESAAAVLVQINVFKSDIEFIKGENSTLRATIDSINNTINTLLEKGFSSDSQCIDPDGNAVNGFSRHVQTAFGENEYWVCGKDVYLGLVISLCDQWWKYVRLNALPGLVTITATNPTYNKILLGSNVNLNDNLSAFAASSVWTDVFGENNIFDWCTLKRVNEGCFHHTHVPAVMAQGDLYGVGSYQLIQTEIPNLVTKEVHKTALNSRYEHVCSWSRMDNWHNTLGFVYHTSTANPGWFFLSIAQQYRYAGIWIDTPLGSMAFHVPRFNAGLWYYYQLYQQTSTARQDFPIDSHFVVQQKHTRHTCIHIYIVQRRAITFFNKGGSDFVRQILTYGPYDCWRVAQKYVPGSEPGSPDAGDNVTYPPSAAISNGDTINSKTGTLARFTYDSSNFPTDDPVCYVTFEGKRVKFFDLTAEQQQTVLGDRVYIYSETDLSGRSMFPNQAFEIEVMAGCAQYSEIAEACGSYDASQTPRVPEFESCIIDLIKYFYAHLKSTNSTLYGDKYFSYFRLEATII